jgi:fumarate reductase subunit C
LTSTRAQLIHELISGISGAVLAVFMWGHLLLVGSILLGTRGFDWMATQLEVLYIAQPTVLGIFVIFLVHAVFASRKIPAQLRERRQMIEISKDLQRSWTPHLDSILWIWQVRTGMVILVLGSCHILLLAMDVLTPLYGQRAGIESATTLARVRGGLWLPYAVLLLCVEFHASVGLYRLAIKWGAGKLPSRRTLARIEQAMFWSILVFGAITLLVLAGLLDPPLAFLLQPAPE